MQKQGKGSHQSKPIQSLSFEELFQMAEQKFDQLDNEEAEYFYGLAYQKNPFHQAVVMCYANVLKQNDKQKQAKRILQKSIKELPNGTYKRYFQLGQIYNSVEAIKAFQTGINQALKHLKNPFKSVTPDQQIKRDVAQAYASIAEICMTDLIDEPQAQAKCIQALQKGKQSDASCIDVLLQTANYQLFKQNFQLAKSCLDLILTFVLQKREQYDSQLLLQASKYYIQLDQFLPSQQLLQTIHEEQGNQSEIVYLLAYCTFKAQKYEECEEYIQEFREGENNIKDEEVEQAMKELVAEMNKIRKKGSANVQDTNENQEMEDQWMDVEDEDN